MDSLFGQKPLIFLLVSTDTGAQPIPRHSRAALVPCEFLTPPPPWQRTTPSPSLLRPPGASRSCRRL